MYMTAENRSEPSTAGITVPKPVLHRAIAASAMGNAVEWFDYGAYAYLTTHIARALFPAGTNGVFWTLAGFAISFLIRPLGGLFWGPLGDRIGRKRVLAMTIIMMAASTALIAFIPSYDTIGIWAPVILYALRILQGFSAGGEYGGAATFMAEYAPKDRRGMYGSFLEVGTLTGFTAAAAIALLLLTVLGDNAMAAWGWRIPFLVAIPLGYIGLYLRSRMEETPVFKEIENESEARADTAVDVYKKLATTYVGATLTLFGLVIALNVVDYTFLAFTPTYLQDALGMSESHALMVPLVGQVVMAILLPFFGRISDTVGRKPMWLFSCIALMLFVVPLYELMGTGLAGAIIGFTIIGILFAPQLSTISATFPAMFPTIARYAGVAIGYNVSTSLFGGTAPVVTQALTESTGNNLMPAYYMAGACLVGAVAAFFLIETKGISLRGTEIPGTEAAFEQQRELAKD
ncbi:MAG TPA: MFS transporter [Gammaproteobacteria bacterium]|nr:MFS transporter [Gammaproteobacteria bacterium]